MGWENRYPPLRFLVYITSFESEIVEAQITALEIRFASTGFCRDDRFRHHVDDDFIDIGQLGASWINPVKIRIALENIPFRRRRGGIHPRLQCWHVRVLGPVLPAFSDMQRAPVLYFFLFTGQPNCDFGARRF